MKHDTETLPAVDAAVMLGAPTHPVPGTNGKMLAMRDADLSGPGVYLFFNSATQRRPSYIGQGSNVLRRLGDRRRETYFAVIDHGYVLDVESSAAAKRLESSLICLLNPTENRERPGVSWGTVVCALLARSTVLRLISWCIDCGSITLRAEGLGSNIVLGRPDAVCSCGSNDADRAESLISGLLRERNDAVEALASAEGRLAELEAERDEQEPTAVGHEDDDVRFDKDGWLVGDYAVGSDDAWE